LSILERATEGLLRTVGASPKKKTESVNDQSGDEIKLVTYVDNKIEEIRASGPRTANEAIWFTNIAYIMGYDSVYFDASRRTFRPIPGTSALDRSRIHVNKILPNFQIRQARLCKNPPRYDVRPNSSDQDDKDAAQLSLKIINDVWDKELINQKRIELMAWMQQCGHAYIKVLWDDSKGELVTDPMSNDSEYEGEIGIEVMSAFEVFVDPLARTLQEAQYVIEAHVRPIQYFRMRYPEKGNLVKVEDTYLSSLQNLQKINNSTNLGPSGSSSVSVQNSAIEKCLYEKPSKKYPKGRMVVVANGVLLEDKELPCGKIPIVKFDDVIVAGKYYSESIITHARPIQDQYNKLITRRAKWTNQLLAGKYIAARDAGLGKESITDDTEVVEYDVVPGSAPPQAMQVPMIPQYAYMEEDRLERLLSELFGIGEVDKSQLPSASIPAIGMQLLVEQTDTRIGITTEHNEYSWAKVGSLILDYAEKYYTTERTLKEAGVSGEYLVHKVTGDGIKGNKDVIVIRGSTLPGSKVLKRQEILNLYSQGILGDPADPSLREKVLSQLEYGDLAETWKDISLDKAQIKKSIEMLKQNIQPDVHEMDNHRLHITTKNQFRKTDSFDRFTPEQKFMFEHDVEEHIQWLTKLMNPDLYEDPALPQPDPNLPPEQQLTAPGGPASPIPPLQEPPTGGL
jgi:hypothetical protein